MWSFLSGSSGGGQQPQQPPPQPQQPAPQQQPKEKEAPAPKRAQPGPQAQGGSTMFSGMSMKKRAGDGPSSLGHSSETSHRESVPIPSAQSPKQASGPAPASSSAFGFLGGGGGGIGLVPAKTAGGDSGHAGAPYSSAPHTAPSSAPGDGDGSGTPMSVGASDVNRPGHASPPSQADAFRPSTSFDSAGRVEDNLGELMGLGPDLSWQPSPSVSVPVPPSDRPTVPTGMGGRSGSAGVGHSLVPSGPVKKTRRAHLPQFAAAAAAPPPSTTGGLPPSPSLPESGVTRRLSGPTGDGHAEVEVSAHAPPSVVSSPAASLSASQARPKPPPPPPPPPPTVTSPSTLESPHPEGECAPVSEPNSVAALRSEDRTDSSGVMRKFLASSSSASPEKVKPKPPPLPPPRQPSTDSKVAPRGASSVSLRRRDTPPSFDSVLGSVGDEVGSLAEEQTTLLAQAASLSKAARHHAEILAKTRSRREEAEARQAVLAEEEKFEEAEELEGTIGELRRKEGEAETQLHDAWKQREEAQAAVGALTVHRRQALSRALKRLEALASDERKQGETQDRETARRLEAERARLVREEERLELSRRHLESDEKRVKEEGDQLRGTIEAHTAEHREERDRVAANLENVEAEIAELEQKLEERRREKQNLVESLSECDIRVSAIRRKFDRQLARLEETERRLAETCAEVESDEEQMVALKSAVGQEEETAKMRRKTHRATQRKANRSLRMLRGAQRVLEESEKVREKWNEEAGAAEAALESVREEAERKSEERNEAARILQRATSALEETRDAIARTENRIVPLEAEKKTAAQARAFKEAAAVSAKIKALQEEKAALEAKAEEQLGEVKTLTERLAEAERGEEQARAAGVEARATRDRQSLDALPEKLRAVAGLIRRWQRVSKKGEKANVKGEGSSGREISLLIREAEVLLEVSWLSLKNMGEDCEKLFEERGLPCPSATRGRGGEGEVLEWGAEFGVWLDSWSSSADKEGGEEISESEEEHEEESEAGKGEAGEVSQIQTGGKRTEAGPSDQRGGEAVGLSAETQMGNEGERDGEKEGTSFARASEKEGGERGERAEETGKESEEEDGEEEEADVSGEVEMLRGLIEHDRQQIDALEAEVDAAAAAEDFGLASDLNDKLEDKKKELGALERRMEGLSKIAKEQEERRALKQKRAGREKQKEQSVPAASAETPSERPRSSPPEEALPSDSGPVDANGEAGGRDDGVTAGITSMMEEGGLAGESAGKVKENGEVAVTGDAETGEEKENHHAPRSEEEDEEESAPPALVTLPPQTEAEAEVDTEGEREKGGPDIMATSDSPVGGREPVDPASQAPTSPSPPPLAGAEGEDDCEAAQPETLNTQKELTDPAAEFPQDSHPPAISNSSLHHAEDGRAMPSGPPATPAGTMQEGDGTQVEKGREETEAESRPPLVPKPAPKASGGLFSGMSLKKKT